MVKGKAVKLAIDFDDVKSAAQIIKGVANRTPVITSRTVNELTGYEVTLNVKFTADWRF